MNDIGREISQSIKESKWLAIKYRNEEKGTTSYWISILDIDPKTRKLKIDMYNHALSDNTYSTWISFDKIEDAKMLEFTSYKGNENLVAKIEKNLSDYSFLHYDGFNNDILSYLLECYKLDNDPSQDKEASTLLSGIDVEVLMKNKYIMLNQEQVDALCRIISFKDQKPNEALYNEFVISRLSVCSKNKEEYVFVYQKMTFDPKTKYLSLDGEAKFNQSFAVDGKCHSLSNYTELNASEFEDLYNQDAEQAENIIRESALHFHEAISTLPNIMILTREMGVNLGHIFSKVIEKHEKNILEVPFRAFFGDISMKDNGKKIPQIVLYDKKVNADQMLVLYNAMKNPVTYVQGPPGTGKTQTLFNVVISCYFNQRTTLITTMNNKPVDDIIKKIQFTSKYGDIPFPFLRLGNMDVVKKATLRIREIYKTDFYGKPNMEKIEQIKANTRDKNAKLSQMLTNYEKRKSLIQQEEFFQKIRESTTDNNSRLNAAIEELSKEIKEIPLVSDDQIMSLFQPASEDSRYIQYLYFSSLAHLLKLRNPEYSRLKEIVYIDDDNERASEFTKWTRIDENMKLLSDAFPIIFSTNISSHNLGSGDFTFDTVIMDEAGQCNLALSLIPISKAKSLLLVGDEDQLQPVVVLLASTNKKLMEKYKISDHYNYCQASIISAMKNEDKVSKKITLRYHYRCAKNIIGFSNRFFYDDKLIIPPSQENGYLKFFDCKNNARTELSNQALEEATGIVEYLKKYGVEDTVVITPFVNQATLINELLAKEHIKNIKAATIHSVQGNEAKTVLLSAAISPRSAKRTLNWLNSHKEIVNVAISRAKKNFILFGDKESFTRLSTDKDSIWNQLIRYTESQGNIEVIKPLPNMNIGYSNGSINEEEFFKTLSHIASIHNAIKVERNILLKDVFPDDKELQNRKLEFDSIISIKKSMFSGYVRTFAFEFQGGEHIFDETRASCDKEKELICQKHGIQFFAIPNSYAKEYTFFIALLKKYAHEAMSEGEQLSLF